jgi:LmbE family N-acetylglucosaminyl deacetylase
MSSDLAPALRAFLRAANGLGARRAEALWAASAALANRLLPWPPPRLWATSGRERVVVVAPHADDETLGCAGTLIRHREAGDRTRIVIVTDGRLSRAYGFDAASMGERRHEEAREVARRMGAELDWVGLAQNQWSSEEGAAALRSVLSELSPTVVYAPSAIDYHPDHRRVATVLAAVLSEGPTSFEVRIYASQVPLTALLVNMVHDVSDLAESMGRASAAYATQREALSYSLRLKRYAGRCYGAGTLAEAFCCAPADVYAAWHARPPATFRSIYPRAWTDPLAALVGWRERMAWRRQARAVVGERRPKSA